MATSVSLPCSFPTDPVHIFLFTEVLNAIELRSRLLAGDTEYLYAFLNADLVFSPLSAELIEIVSQLQLLAAVNRAVHDEHYGQMRTKHLHSEIVYALAATQNIAEAFKTFGLGDYTKNVVVVKVSSTDPADHIRKIVKGKEIRFDDRALQSIADLAKVHKYYKLIGSKDGKQKDGTEQRRWTDAVECTKVIVGSIALRGSS